MTVEATTGATTSTDAASTTATTTAAEESTITLDTDTPVEESATKVKEPTAEEKAAEDARRAALTDDERKAEDDAKAANTVPEKYEPFKLPDGVQPMPEVMSKFEGVAKELGLTQDKAQKLADIGGEMQAQWVKDQQAIIANAQKDWANQSRTDKEFGGKDVKANVAIAEAAIKEFTTPEYRQLLKDSGLGNHPEVIRTFYRMGKVMMADKTIAANSGDPNAKRDESAEARAQRLYGATNKT